MVKQQRLRFGFWSVSVTKSMTWLPPRVKRAAKIRGISETALIREAICHYLAKEDDVVAENFKNWVELHGER